MRLNDIGWWMRSLCQIIAVRANRKDKEISTGDDLLLLDRTARQAVDGKPGSSPATALPIFERLSLNPRVSCQLVSQFGRLFYNVAGVPQTIDATTRIERRTFRTDIEFEARFVRISLTIVVSPLSARFLHIPPSLDFSCLSLINHN